MVRRHRVEEDELWPLMRAASEKLNQLSKEKPNHRDIEPLFKILWRFKEHKPGPPAYPEINQQTILETLLALQSYLYEDTD